MWVIVGLGNPGASYADSRHNVGFTTVDALARRWRIVLNPHGSARVGSGIVAGQPAVLVEPQTYMNRSGEALAELDVSAPDDHMLVVHDDLDLPAGNLRIRQHGGSGGHRGVASIVERYGMEFVRVRVGIGRPPAGVVVSDHVLNPPAADEQAVLQESIARACAAIESVLGDGLATAMNRFNVRLVPAANGSQS
jgi:PTH1 family peptidyl-tRNA hydrolase